KISIGSTGRGFRVFVRRLLKSILTCLSVPLPTLDDPRSRENKRTHRSNLQPGDDRQAGSPLGEKRFDIKIGDWKRPCFMHVSIARIHDVRVEASPVGVWELAQSNNGVV